jgi:hypothetical protein
MSQASTVRATAGRTKTRPTYFPSRSLLALIVLALTAPSVRVDGDWMRLAKQFGVHYISLVIWSNSGSSRNRLPNLRNMAMVPHIATTLLCTPHDKPGVKVQRKLADRNPAYLEDLVRQTHAQASSI